MNLGPFLKEWWVSIVWLKDVPDGAKKGWERLFQGLAFLGVSASVLNNFWMVVQLFAPYLLLPAIAYLAWKAGRAWERTRGPSVKIGSEEIDVGIKVFFVMVNNGSIPAKIRIRIVRVTDSFGTRHIEHPYEGHWRGRPRDFDGDLVEYDEAQYGLLGVGQFPSGNPTLFIYSKDSVGQSDQSQHAGIPISRDLPLKEQGTTTVTFVVTSEAKTGEKGEKIERRFSVIPDPEEAVGYKVGTAVFAIQTKG